jgi:hypothetical protein
MHKLLLNNQKQTFPIYCHLLQEGQNKNISVKISVLIFGCFLSSFKYENRNTYMVVYIKNQRYSEDRTSIGNFNILCVNKIHFRNQQKKKKYISTIEESETILLTLLFLNTRLLNFSMIYVYFECIFLTVCLSLCTFIAME